MFTTWPTIWPHWNSLIKNWSKRSRTMIWPTFRPMKPSKNSRSKSSCLRKDITTLSYKSRTKQENLLSSLSPRKHLKERSNKETPKSPDLRLISTSCLDRKTRIKKLSKCSKLTSPKPSNKSLKRPEPLLTSRQRKSNWESKSREIKRRTPNWKWGSLPWKRSTKSSRKISWKTSAIHLLNFRKSKTWHNPQPMLEDDKTSNKTSWTCQPFWTDQWNKAELTSFPWSCQTQKTLRYLSTSWSSKTSNWWEKMSVLVKTCLQATRRQWTMSKLSHNRFNKSKKSWSQFTAPRSKKWSRIKTKYLS